MKFIKHLFSLFLTLSLSAIALYPSLPVSNTVFLASSGVNADFLNGVDDYSKNSFIDLSDDEHLEVFTYNDQIVYLTDNDIYLMSQIVYAESKGEPFEGKVAVASVILNRVLSPRFPDTIESVVFQPNAFSCVIDGTINVEPTQECYDAVHEAINGYDPTEEALFFYNPDIATCSWMLNVEKSNTTSIGQHIFFSL